MLAATETLPGNTSETLPGKTNVFGGYLPPGAQAASTLFVPDSDGAIRRMTNVEAGLTTFATAAAAIADGKPVPHAFKVVIRGPVKTYVQMPLRTHWIDFAGPAGTVKTYPFSKVYLGKVPSSAFAGKIVVLGPSAPALQDVHATSVGGEPMSDAELQANAIETAIHGFPLRGAPDWMNVLLIVLLGMLPLAGFRLRTVYMLVIPAAAAALFAVAVQVAFDNGLVLAFTYPLLALVLTTTLMLVRRARQAMSRSRGFAG